MSTTGQGRISNNGKGISSRGHPAKYAPSKPKAAPEAPNAGRIESALKATQPKEPPSNPMR